MLALHIDVMLIRTPACRMFMAMCKVKVFVPRQLHKGECYIVVEEHSD